MGFPHTLFPSDSSAETFEIVEAVDALRGGAAIVSAGAFARVDVDGSGPGATVSATGSVDLHLEIQAPRAIDVTHVVVFASCDEVAQLPADAPGGVVKLSATVTVPISGDTQIVVAAFGADRLPDGLPQFEAAGVPRVLTNPIFVDADGDGSVVPGGRICAYDVSP